MLHTSTPSTKIAKSPRSVNGPGIKREKKKWAVSGSDLALIMMMSPVAALALVWSKFDQSCSIWCRKDCKTGWQSEEEGSSHKFRRMNSNSPWRKLEKGAEHDKVNEDATLTPKTAKKDISLPSAIDGAMEETLEGLVLQWTNLTREEIEIE